MTVFCLSWPSLDAAGSSSRQNQTRHVCASCLESGSVRFAANAIGSGPQAATSSEPVSVGRPRAKVSFRYLNFFLCAFFFPLKGDLHQNDCALVVAMVTDVHLNEVFSGEEEEEEETFQRNVFPEVEEIPQGNKEKERGGLVCQIKSFVRFYMKKILISDLFSQMSTKSETRSRTQC